MQICDPISSLQAKSEQQIFSQVLSHELKHFVKQVPDTSLWHIETQKIISMAARNHYDHVKLWWRISSKVYNSINPPEEIWHNLQTGC